MRRRFVVYQEPGVDQTDQSLQFRFVGNQEQGQLQDGLKNSLNLWFTKNMVQRLLFRFVVNQEHGVKKDGSHDDNLRYVANKEHEMTRTDQIYE